MGFFKRFLSLGSLKSKKKQKRASTKPPPAVKADAQGRIVQDKPRRQDPDANRLLRTTSARFADTQDVDVPPLPEPTNTLTPARSLSPAPSAATSTTVHRRGTFVVKVHERQLHSRTEFPHANPPLPTRNDPTTPDDDTSARRHRLRDSLFTPKDQSRLLALRHDPSVASLLNMYDDNGCLGSYVFSNTPDTPAPIHHIHLGHEPRRRTGSTLHELLGEPLPQPAYRANANANAADAIEGDISWAERFLRERLDGGSETSSLALQPPHTRFSDHDRHSEHALADLSADLSLDFPAISSMEVELSAGSPAPSPTPAPDTAGPTPGGGRAVDPKTPQSASTVFGFLTERCKFVRDRTVSALPSLDSDTASSTTSKILPPTPGTASPVSPSSPVSSLGSRTRSRRSTAQIQSVTVMTPAIAFARSASSVRIAAVQDDPENPFLDHAPKHCPLVDKIPPSRIPRGPRLRGAAQDVPADQADAAVTHMYAQPSATLALPRASRSSSRERGGGLSASRTPSRPSTAGSSVSAVNDAADAVAHRVRPGRPSHVRKLDWFDGAAAYDDDEEDKENSADASRPKHHRTLPLRHFDPPSNQSHPHPYMHPLQQPLNRNKSTEGEPVTPARARTVFEARYPNYAGGEPPSPASSSELSPLGQDMMHNVRKERMRARDAQRWTGRVRGSGAKE